MGLSRVMVWQIAAEKRWRRGCSPAQRASLEAALATPVFRNRPGPKRRMGRDAAYAIVEAASPTRSEYLTKLRTAQILAHEFTQLPPERRAAAARAPYGAGGEYDRVERAWRAAHRADRPSFYRLAQRHLDDVWERNPNLDATSGSAHTVTNLAKGLKDRLRTPLRILQIVGRLVPSVIHRDQGEEFWTPTPEALEVQMISRATFEAWPATAAMRPRPMPPLTPVDDLDHDPPSARLEEFRAALPAMRALRDEAQGTRPADPTRQALDCLCYEITCAARWARTVTHETATAPPRRGDAGLAA